MIIWQLFNETYDRVRLSEMLGVLNLHISVTMQIKLRSQW